MHPSSNRTHAGGSQQVPDAQEGGSQAGSMHAGGSQAMRAGGGQTRGRHVGNSSAGGQLVQLPEALQDKILGQLDWRRLALVRATCKHMRAAVERASAQHPVVQRALASGISADAEIRGACSRMHPEGNDEDRALFLLSTPAVRALLDAVQLRDAVQLAAGTERLRVLALLVDVLGVTTGDTFQVDCAKPPPPALTALMRRAGAPLMFMKPTLHDVYESAYEHKPDGTASAVLSHVLSHHAPHPVESILRLWSACHRNAQLELDHLRLLRPLADCAKHFEQHVQGLCALCALHEELRPYEAAVRDLDLANAPGGPWATQVQERIQELRAMMTQL